MNEQPDAATPEREGVALRDCLFLSVCVWCSALPYLSRLGFYSDDWPLLAMFTQSADQSVLGLFRHGYGANELTRPVYVAFLAILYRLFGLHPLGYHLVNHGVLTAAVCLFYLTLRALRVTRVPALCIPLVFLLLPNYSTNRLWIAACHGFLSLAFCFLSIYSDTTALSGPPTRFWRWRPLALASLVASILTYELTIPLLLANALLIAVAPAIGRHHFPGERWTQRRFVVALLNACILVWMAIFIATATVREITTANFVGHAAGVVKGAVVMTLGRLGAGLPFTVWRAIVDRHDPLALGFGAVLGLLVFVYLHRVTGPAESTIVGRADWARVVATGPLLIGVGYAIFIATPEIVFTATGVGNRTAIVAALGVATSFVGLIGLAGTWCRSRPSQCRFFCSVLTLLCLGGFSITADVASYWARAYRKEEAILADIQEHVGNLPAGSTLILDGICPYDGPAVVFESSWDLAGALQIAYHDTTLRADVVSPYLTVTGNGLTTLLYGHLAASYPYGSTLVLYNYKNQTVHQLVDLGSAQQYLDVFNPDRSNGCPNGLPGHGVEILHWGTDPL